MEENVKNICYDRALKLEAYSFNGIVQPFPNHIHDYYVAGIVEKACRFMKTEYGSHSRHNNGYENARYGW